MVVAVNCVAFLREAKQRISVGQRDFIKRTYTHPSGRTVKWIEALMDIGLTDLGQCWQEILDLGPEHYDSGPHVDRDFSQHTVWVFKKEINGRLTYIKLKIDERGCVCLSFHEDWTFREMMERSEWDE
ncbi:MAG: hypothetical protein ACRC5C_14950 [Bacilli bacterium]